MHNDKHDFIPYDGAMTSSKYRTLTDNIYASDYEDLEETRQRKIKELETAYNNFDFPLVDSIEKEIDNLHTIHNQRKVSEYQSGKVANEKAIPKLEKAMYEKIADERAKHAALLEAEKVHKLSMNVSAQAMREYQHAVDYPAKADDWISYFIDREKTRRMKNRF